MLGVSAAAEPMTAMGTAHVGDLVPDDPPTMVAFVPPRALGGGREGLDRLIAPLTHHHEAAGSAANRTGNLSAALAA
jgi:hypothetical protein